jgi:hypothetical protein
MNVETMGAWSEKRRRSGLPGARPERETLIVQAETSFSWENWTVPVTPGLPDRTQIADGILIEVKCFFKT